MLPARGPLALAAVTALAAAAMDAGAGGRRWKNLLRNPSFEAVGPSGVPAGWHWAEGRAKASLVVDEAVARSGKRSAKIVNPTAKEPHVYSYLFQQPWVPRASWRPSAKNPR